jgi:hypothetical protein
MHHRAGRSRVASAFIVGLALAVCWLLVLATPAEAYIDPSAGGMLIQLLLAGTAGVAVLGKLFWGRIKRLFGLSSGKEPASEVRDAKPPHDTI